MGQCTDSNILNYADISPYQDSLIKNRFVTSDCQDEETVEPIEVHWTLRKAFPDIPCRTSLIIAKFIDRNNSGTISRCEFNKYLGLLSAVRREEDLLEVIFKSADINGNGFIEYGELQLIQDKFPNLELEIEQYSGKTLDYKQFLDVMFPFRDHIVGFHDIWQTSRWGDGLGISKQKITKEEAIQDSRKNGLMMYEQLNKHNNKEGNIINSSSTLISDPEQKMGMQDKSK